MQGSNDLLLGINEPNLGELAMDIDGMAEEAMDIFLSIDAKMQELSSTYHGKEFNCINNIYKDLRLNYSIVKENIMSYSEDLIALINKVRAGDKEIAFTISGFIDEAKDRAKKVREK